MTTRLKNILFVCLLASGVMGCGPAYVRHYYGPDWYGTPSYHYSPSWYSYSYSPTWDYWDRQPRWHHWHHRWYW
ncbi:MAG TPA: hypothetical protein VGX03_14240 [Candidatus Binatia bacterium]|jgi:hypothetical protein|nr:hypothetical protein [Candidatus Binatia bacterium]